MTSPNPSTPPANNTTPDSSTPPDLSSIDPHDLLMRRNPADFDIQEGQERIQSDPNPDPETPPARLADKPVNAPRH